MAIITKSELRKYRWKNINDSKGLRDHMHVVDTGKNIFLSHRQIDKKYVGDLKKLLGELDIDLYIDWLDHSTPEHANAETAEKIKNKIKENDKFILLATDSAIGSKWCNWELGFADNIKFDKDKLALFPVKRDHDNWSGSEYTQLYPIIEKEIECYRDIYMIKYPNGDSMELKTWLQK